jgi:High potential iron-sulfur protein
LFAGLEPSRHSHQRIVEVIDDLHASKRDNAGQHDMRQSSHQHAKQICEGAQYRAPACNSSPPARWSQPVDATRRAEAIPEQDCRKTVRSRSKRRVASFTVKPFIIKRGQRAMTESSRISRRQVLSVATGASVTGVAAVVGVSTAAQAAKTSQKTVKYQDTPKGEQRCENCMHFEPPSACKTVDGTVAAQGWCIVYAKKPA